MYSESENPLRDQLKAELDNSQWLQKFREIGENLQLIKSAIPATQLCQLKWNTSNNGLEIYCLNEETWNYLQLQVSQISTLPFKGDRITIFWQDKNITCEVINS